MIRIQFVGTVHLLILHLCYLALETACRSKCLENLMTLKTQKDKHAKKPTENTVTKVLNNNGISSTVQK